MCVTGRSIVSFVLEEPQRLDLSLEPLDDFVVVQPSEEETETRTGLIIPASDDAGCSTGIVTATGPDAQGIEPGDKVLFSPEDRYEVEVRGDEYLILRERDIHAVASERNDGATGLYL
jgi:chaperonin GroES